MSKRSCAAAESTAGAVLRMARQAIGIRKGEQHGENSLVRNIWHGGRSGRTVCRIFSGLPDALPVLP